MKLTQFVFVTFEPPHDKTQWVAKNPSFLHADNKDSDQTGRMPRLIWVFAGRTGNFVGFDMMWLICTLGYLVYKE